MSTRSHLNDYIPSTPAQTILEQIDPSEKLVAFLEELDHDGYDQDGAESDIWDLFFITLKDEYYVFHAYHWENWFYEETVKEYKLVKKNYVKNIILNEYHFEKVKELSKYNTDLKHFVNGLNPPKCVFRILKMFINKDAFAYYQSSEKSYLMFKDGDEIKINEFDNVEIFKHYQLFNKMVSDKINIEKENNRDFNIYSIKYETKSNLAPSKCFAIKDLKKHISKGKIIKWLKMSSTI
jgi:hypothetical protein